MEQRTIIYLGMEYEKMGKEIPYDFKALSEERQKVRDRINELQEQIASLPEEEVEVEEQVIVTNIEE